MSRSPTLEDVARAAGVSTMTVSNTYSRPAVVAASTRLRVLDAAKALGYFGPNPAGRSLRTGRSDVVGVVVGDSLSYLFSDPGAASLMQGLALEAAERDLALQIIHAAGPGAVDKVRRAIVDSWVLYGLTADLPAVVAVRESRRPLVTICGEPLPGHPSVNPDEGQAAKLVAEHLAGFGLRDYVVVTPSASSPVWSRRVSGYRSALAGPGRNKLRVVECGHNSRRAGRQVGEALLEGRPGSGGRAVIAATDVLALGVLDAARERSIRVPDEVSVVGFDDIEEAAAASPPLTTVRQALREAGRLAVGLATGTAGRRPLRNLLPVELVVRETTGPRRRAGVARPGSKLPTKLEQQAGACGG